MRGGIEEEVGNLCLELRAKEREDRVALRGEQRYVARLEPATPAAPSGAAPTFQVDATYLVTGGLGGLGLSLARWMVSRGARHLALAGRRGAASEAQRAAVAGLEADGARVRVYPVDVADPVACAGMIEAIEAEGPALRGVIHTAAVLDDGIVEGLDAGRIRRVLAPKAVGAWNLHRLTADRGLEFFVMYGSAASMLGSPGQGSYAAANAFLEALAELRRSQGLPGLAVAWGAFSGVGMAAQAGLEGKLAQRGMGMLTPEEGTSILGRLMVGGETRVGVMRLRVKQWLEAQPHAASPFVAGLAETARVKADPRHLEAILAAGLEARGVLVEAFVREQVARVLRTEPGRVEREAPFKRLGVDSLMGLEIRNRLEASLDLSLSATLIWTYGNVAALSDHLLGLIEAVHGKGGAGQAVAEQGGSGDGKGGAGQAVADGPGGRGLPGPTHETGGEAGDPSAGTKPGTAGQDEADASLAALSDDELIASLEALLRPEP